MFLWPISDTETSGIAQEPLKNMRRHFLSARKGVLNSLPDAVTRNEISIRTRSYGETSIDNLISIPVTSSEGVWSDENILSSTFQVVVNESAEPGTVVGSNYDPML